MQAKPNPLKTKSFQLALDIVEFTHQIEQLKKFAIANQLLKSGTSVGANIHEAQTPESKNDFVHKLKIAAKEASETEFWLLLCKESPYLPDPGSLSGNVNEIQRILSASISSCKSRD
jgi:four helix bundle protein